MSTAKYSQIYCIFSTDWPLGLPETLGNHHTPCLGTEVTALHPFHWHSGWDQGCDFLLLFYYHLYGVAQDVLGHCQILGLRKKGEMERFSLLRFGVDAWVLMEQQDSLPLLRTSEENLKSNVRLCPHGSSSLLEATFRASSGCTSAWHIQVPVLSQAPCWASAPACHRLFSSALLGFWHKHREGRNILPSVVMPVLWTRNVTGVCTWTWEVRSSLMSLSLFITREGWELYFFNL